jgi:hypothetical protein
MSSSVAALAGCLVLVLATDAHAQDAGASPGHRVRAKGAHDARAELAWARGEWPDELDKAQLAYRSRRLLSWVPEGKTVKAYIFTEYYDCAPVELSRCERKGCGYLVGRVFPEEPVREDGRVMRLVYTIALDDRISDEHDCVTFERRGKGGRWHEDSNNCMCTGHHPPEPVLSFVDGSKAIYGGEPLVIEGVCAGPKEWLSCTHGGERPCDTCKEVALEVEVDGATPALTVTVGEKADEHRQRCNEPCPETTHPQIERLRILSKHMRRRMADVTSSGGLPSLWRPLQDEPPSGVYKSKQDCLREHPPEHE